MYVHAPVIGNDVGIDDIWDPLRARRWNHVHGSHVSHRYLHGGTGTGFKSIKFPSSQCIRLKKYLGKSKVRFVNISFELTQQLHTISITLTVIFIKFN